MYENYYALPAEKQQRVRNAAFREFGRFGYKKTSAEQIAQSAGIAKGMVFHYFGTKRGLFEYLMGYANDYFEQWFGRLDEKIHALDFIEQYRSVTKIKLAAYLKEPYVFEFFTMLFMHPENQEISEAIKRGYEKCAKMRTDAFAALQSGENTQRFRADIDKDKAKRYIGWLVDGYSQQLLAILNGRPLADLDLDIYWKEFDEILDDMRRLFYDDAASAAERED